MDSPWIGVEYIHFEKASSLIRAGFHFEETRSSPSAPHYYSCIHSGIASNQFTGDKGNIKWRAIEWTLQGKFMKKHNISVKLTRQSITYLYSENNLCGVRETLAAICFKNVRLLCTVLDSILLKVIFNFAQTANGLAVRLNTGRSREVRVFTFT